MNACGLSDTSCSRSFAMEHGRPCTVWSDAALAARYDYFRAAGGDATTSRNTIANWRNGKFLPALC
jgi:hypothetical protein